MINITDLWKKRFQHYIQEMRRYLKLILNDHLRLALVFAVGAIAFYYQQWLKEIPADFPALFIIVVLISLLLTKSPIRTFLKSADLIFLLPVETHLRKYFTYSKIYALVIQGYIMIISFAVLLPLYFSQYDANAGSVLFMFAAILVNKWWNIWLRGYMQHFSDKTLHYSDWIVRFAVNVLFVSFLLKEANILFLLAIVVLMVLLFLYYKTAAKNKGVQWEYLIDLESSRIQAFYRIANMFTDVPRLREQVRKRKWLNWLSRFIPFSQQSTFSYIYLKTFIRTSDYLGIYVRLLVIGSLLIYYLPFTYGKLISLVLFLYFSGFQLITLFRHHSTKIWLDLYPVETRIKERSFITLQLYLSLFQSLIFVIMVFLSAGMFYGGIAIFIGVLFSFLFCNVYVKNRLRKYS